MFLGAGSVMHGMDDDVNMRHYGGLARSMRITFVTFAAGYLAIIGFPFFAGYYSKDHIIEAAFEHNARSSASLALLGAGVTAFYMTRLMLMTFLGAQALGEGRAPARVAAGDDGAADRARRRVRARRPGAQQLDRGLAAPGDRRGRRGRARADRAAPLLPRRRGHPARGRRRAWRSASLLFGPRRAIPREAPSSRSPLDHRRPARPLRRRLQRGRLHAARASR